MTPEEKDFVREHLNSDVNKLLLNPPSEFKSGISWLCDQIIARQKAKHKLPEWYDDFDLEFPPPLSVEQSSSETTASYKASLIKGEKFADLTGGMGVDCLAFAKRFSESHYVEKNEKLAGLFKANCVALGAKMSVHSGAAEDFLDGLEEQLDLIFIDPARRDASARKVFRFQDCTPNVVELLPVLSSKTRKLMIKASPLIDLKLGLEELERVTEIHVVSLKNECKEVLFILDFEQGLIENPKIRCVNLGSNKGQVFDFNLDQESDLSVEFSDYKNFLFIPNASILKAGAFKSVAMQTGAAKIAPNTHLYTAVEDLPNFPGRRFQILDSHPDKKKLSLINGLDVISRNHPLKAHEIVRKYKIKEGGDLTLIAFRDQKNKPHMVIARQLEPTEPKGQTDC